MMPSISSPAQEKRPPKATTPTLGSTLPASRPLAQVQDVLFGNRFDVLSVYSRDSVGSRRLSQMTDFDDSDSFRHSSSGSSTASGNSTRRSSPLPEDPPPPPEEEKELPRTSRSLRSRVSWGGLPPDTASTVKTVGSFASSATEMPHLTDIERRQQRQLEQLARAAAVLQVRCIPQM